MKVGEEPAASVAVSGSNSGIRKMEVVNVGEEELFHEPQQELP